MVPAFEKVVVEDGIILLKYWLEVSPEEQTRRLEGRIDDGRKIWKLSDMDLKSYSRWYDYSRARDEMFLATDTSWAPWYVAHADNKRRARFEHHHPPSEPHPIRRAAATGGRAAETTGPRQLQGG
jgi:polyphosphate kinase 2 (PPK2 family)